MTKRLKICLILLSFIAGVSYGVREREKGGDKWCERKRKRGGQKGNINRKYMKKYK